MKTKDTDLYFVYALLFFILGNTEDTLWVAISSDIGGIVFSLLSIYYLFKDVKKDS